MRHFNAISPVGWVVVKADPVVYGDFVFKAILSNEGRTLVEQRRLDWCLTPNCTCKDFIALKSPLEIGVTIDDLLSLK